MFRTIASSPKAKLLKETLYPHLYEKYKASYSADKPTAFTHKPGLQCAINEIRLERPTNCVITQKSYINKTEAKICYWQR